MTLKNALIWFALAAVLFVSVVTGTLVFQLRAHPGGLAPAATVPAEAPPESEAPPDSLASYSPASARPARFEIGDVRRIPGNHYLADLDLIGRFPPDLDRIQVYIEDGRNVPGWQPDLNDAIREAVGEWDSALQGAVRLEITDQPEEAQIQILWNKNFSSPDSISEMGERVGQTSFPAWQHGYILEARIEMAAYSKLNGDYLTYEEARLNALHELGHALGIAGHSSSRMDLMYPVMTPGKTGLSSRDIATLREIYAHP